VSGDLDTPLLLTDGAVRARLLDRLPADQEEKAGSDASEPITRLGLRESRTGADVARAIELGTHA
jgi:hypothetical protein